MRVGITGTMGRIRPPPRHRHAPPRHRHAPQRMCPLRETNLPLLPCHPLSTRYLVHFKRLAPGSSTVRLQCHMSILRNDHGSCQYLCNFPVNFKVVPYTMLMLRIILYCANYFFQMWLGSMSHVIFFRKWPSNLEFKSPIHFHNEYTLNTLFFSLRQRLDKNFINS